MRVVHVVDDLRAIGGVQTYLRELLPALRDRGVDGVLVAAAGDAEFAGTPVVVVPEIAGDGALVPTDNFRRALADLRGDVTYVHIALSPSVARAAASVGRVVVYAHDYFMVCPGAARYLHAQERFCTEGPGLRCFLRAYTERSTNRRPDRLLRAYRRARAWPDAWREVDAVFVASPFVRDLLIEDGLAPDQVRLLPYPVAAAGVSTNAEHHADVVFVGRLVSSKGVDVLLDALGSIEDATAVIAGDGPERPALEQRSEALGLGSRVRFVGWINDEERAALFAGARVAALPSRWQEPFGIVGVEALAAGCPVVASDVGGVGSWLPDGEAGLLVPPGDAPALAAALRRLLGDDRLRMRLGSAGPAAAARFSIDRHLELLLPELGVG